MGWAWVTLIYKLLISGNVQSTFPPGRPGQGSPASPAPGCMSRLGPDPKSYRLTQAMKLHQHIRAFVTWSWARWKGDKGQKGRRGRENRERTGQEVGPSRHTAGPPHVLMEPGGLRSTLGDTRRCVPDWGQFLLPPPLPSCATLDTLPLGRAVCPPHEVAVGLGDMSLKGLVYCRYTEGAQ